MHQPSQYNKTTWQEQLDHLLSTNIAGAANNDDNDSGVVVDRDFFSKWTLRYHHAPLESQFHQYRSTTNSREATLTLVAGLLLTAVLGLVDYLLTPLDLFKTLAVLRFGVAEPMFVIALLIARIGRQRLGRGIHWMGMLLVAVTGAVALANAHACANAGDDGRVRLAYFMSEFALVIMYAFLSVHVRFLYPLSIFTLTQSLMHT